jgi:hypothetical protein
MVDGLNIPLRNITKISLAISVSRVGRGLRGSDNGSDVTSEQYKPTQNCHYESPHV